LIKVKDEASASKETLFMRRDAVEREGLVAPENSNKLTHSMKLRLIEEVSQY
jgi:hypothetical protein